MKSRAKFDLWLVLRVCCILTALIYIIYASIRVNQHIKPLKVNMYIYFLLLALLSANDLLKSRIFAAVKYRIAASILASMLILIALQYISVNSPLTIIFGVYYLTLLYDILNAPISNKKKNQKYLSILHFSLFVMFLVFSTYTGLKSFFNPTRGYYSFPSIKQIINKSPALETILDYILYVPIYFCFHFMFKFDKQMRKYKLLFKRYKNANIKLIRLAKKEKELVLANERNRLAQEIHDSVGHSLTALIMHLDVMESTLYDSESSLKPLLIKSQDLARTTLAEIRKSVCALKEGSRQNSFALSVKELIDNFSSLDNIKIHFLNNVDTERLSPDLKTILYRTIQEAITNSINHGKADDINISISLIGDGIHLLIADNGLGTDDIVFGNGLTGIEKRLCLVGGTVNFKSQNNEGFEIDIHIPLNS